MPAQPASESPQDLGPWDSRAGRASWGRRVVALFIDWFVSQAVVVGLLRVDPTGGGAAALAPLATFFVLTVILVSFTGSTLGHRLLGLQVWQVRPGPFPVQVLIRTALLSLVIPAVLTASDGRGLHDLAAGTRIVRPRPEGT